MSQTGNLENTHTHIHLAFFFFFFQFSASVIGCNYNPDLEVLEALDTWNPANERDNSLVEPQRNYLQNGSYSDGRISCT